MSIGVEFGLRRELDYESQGSIPRVGVVYRKDLSVVVSDRSQGKMASSLGERCALTRTYSRQESVAARKSRPNNVASACVKREDG